MYDYEGNRELNSAPMRKGDKMTVLKYKATGDWVLVQLDSIQTWEPVSYLSIQDSNKSNGYTRPRSMHLSGKSVSNNRKKAVVIADFEGIDHSEMSVKKGEIVQISKENEEWLYGSVGARVRNKEIRMICRKVGFLPLLLTLFRESFLYLYVSPRFFICFV